jgi:hypothetical protein
MGVPTYGDHGFMHRAGVETLENALLGVVAGLRGLGAGGTFEGVALYAGWTTDEADWVVYERVWRGAARWPTRTASGSDRPQAARVMLPAS